MRITPEFVCGPRCLVSFPKSGRTWLRVMLDELGIEADYTHAGAAYGNPQHMGDLSVSLNKEYNQVLVLLRDPRDTVVSGYYHATKRLKNYEGPISAFIRDPRLGVTKIVRFHILWRELATKSDNVAIVTYEAMHENTVAALKSAALFFGVQPPLEELVQVVARNSFAAMQDRERRIYGERYGDRLLPRDPQDIDSFKVRKGRVGGYMEELCPHDIAYCNEILSEARSEYL